MNQLPLALTVVTTWLLVAHVARAQEPDYQEIEPVPVAESYDSLDTEFQLPRGPVEVADSVRAKARDPKHEFCTNPDYILHVRERPYCPFADTARSTCPEFATACARPAEQDRGEFGLSGAFGEKKRGGSLREEKEPEEKPEPTTVALPEWVGGLFRIVFWLLIGALGVAVVALLVGAFTKSQKEQEDATEGAGGEPARTEATDAPRVVESDVARLLARARTHAAAGRYDAAVDDLYAALLRRLEGDQLLVLERHRTNGDYVRALREHPDWQRLLRDCGRDVERAQFGKSRADGVTFQTLLGRIEPVVTRGLALLFVLSTSLVEIACSGAADTNHTEKKHWGVLGDTSPRGLSLFRSLLEDDGYTVQHRVRKAAALDDETGMLVVYDDTSLEDEDWKALERWVASGHELWLLGDPEAAAHFGGKESGTACAPPIALLDDFPASHTDANGSTRPLVLTSISGTLEPAPELVPLVACSGSPLVSRRRVGDGTVTFFPDLAPLSNAALVSADNAVVVMALVGAWPKTVEFAGGLTGAGAESPYQALMNAKLGQVLLQIAILMLVWYLAHGMPFATLRDPVAAGRRRFLDHLTALGRVFQRAGARQHALHHYAAWALGKLNDRVRPGQRMSVIELGSALAKRTGRPEADVIRTLAEAATARNQPDAPLSGDELGVQRRLEALVIATGGNK